MGRKERKEHARALENMQRAQRELEAERDQLARLVRRYQDALQWIASGGMNGAAQEYAEQVLTG